jgi:hypothetical protein
MNKIKKELSLAIIFILLGTILCQEGYALRIPMNGYKKLSRIIASSKEVHINLNYEGSEKERVYYETIIGWVTYILENYKLRFGGNKLIFMVLSYLV